METYRIKSFIDWFGKFLIFLFKLDLAISLALFSYAMLVLPVYLVGYIGSDSTLWLLGIYGGLLGTILLAWRNAGTRAGIGFAAAPFGYSWHLTNELFIRGHPYYFYTRIGAIGWVAIVLTTSMLAISALALIVKSIKKFVAHDGVQRSVKAIRSAAQAQRGIMTFSLTLILICGAYVGITVQSYPRQEITVVPQDYRVNFAFWAIGSHASYTPPQLNELNDHNVTLVAGMAGDLTNPATYIATRDTMVSELAWWKANCSNVKFSITIAAQDGLWDGNAEQATEQAKAVINITNTYNLTNVVGETLDWESAVNAPDPAQNQQAVATWNAFFDWKAINGPNITVTLINDVWLYYDSIDSDNDLHVTREAVAFECTRFDEYAPGMYRCTYGGAMPYGDPVSVSSAGGIQDTYDLYLSMQEHARTMERTFSNLDKMGVYLGETNCSCYGNGTPVYENGQYQGTGFDMFIRDCRICKAFGPKMITVFLLFTAPTGDGYIMGGAFDSYGDDFLDRLETEVNGVNSTWPITIQRGPIGLVKTGFPGAYYPYFLDLIYNLDHPVEFVLTIIVLLAIGLAIFWTHRKLLLPKPDSEARHEGASK
nr:hypothetical protein [Candidatus Sigynarchaeota archaeon]